VQQDHRRRAGFVQPVNVEKIAVRRGQDFTAKARARAAAEQAGPQRLQVAVAECRPWLKHTLS